MTARAIALQSEHLAIQYRLGHQATISASSHNLGLFLFYHDEYDRAAALLEASLQFEREQDDRRRMVTSLVNLGMLSFARGDLHRAQALHEEGLAIAWALGDPARRRRACTWCCWIAALEYYAQRIIERQDACTSNHAVARVAQELHTPRAIQ